MSRKREKPYFFRHGQPAISKRRRSFVPSLQTEDDTVTHKPPPPPALFVRGIPAGCSVLELKSRFEIYGSISRIRIIRDGVGSVTYRSAESAQDAVAASLDPSSGITIESKKLEVTWASDPLAQWREGVAGSRPDRDKTTTYVSSSSKLVRAEMPLRRHGRGSKLASAIVNPRTNSSPPAASSSSIPDTFLNGREIIAYDDIL